MTQVGRSILRPPGPAEQYDLEIVESSFPVVAELLQTYPDICWLQTSRRADSCLINHPDLIKRILIDNNRNYRKGHGFERVKMLLGNGIIVSDGETWKRQRRMVQPSFHRDMLRHLTPIIQDRIQLLRQELTDCASKSKTIDLNETMSRFALDVILRSLFGEDLDRMCDEHGSNPFTIFTEHSERNLNLAVQFRALNRSMQQVIESRRQTPEASERTDMLAALMAARDLEGQPMPDKALIDELMTLIVAGHETSAVTLTWMWYLLSQHPEVEQRLHAEVDGLSGEKGSCPDYDTACGLEYSKQVMYEALRLYPPVWLFTRRAIKDDQLGDYHIPAGTDIFISPYYLHRRADLWPEAESFDPERFTAEAMAEQHRTGFIPFSAGPRKCIGDVFAILEVQLQMGTLAREFIMRAESDQPPELEPAINLRSKQTLYMQPILRS